MKTYIWITVNFDTEKGNWLVFYYCPGAGMETGNRVYYGRSEFKDESTARDDASKWESRWSDYTAKWPYVPKSILKPETLPVS